MDTMKCLFWGKVLGLLIITGAAIAIKLWYFKYIALVLFIYHIRYIIKYMAFYNIRFGLKTERFLAFFLDLCILIFIYGFVLNVCRVISYDFVIVLSVFCIVYFFARDGFSGQGVGKHLIGLKVIPSSPLRLFIRNVTLLIWPFELLCFLIRGERISDKWLKCKVIKCQDKKHRSVRCAYENMIIIAVATIIVSFIMINLPKLRDVWSILY